MHTKCPFRKPIQKFLLIFLVKTGIPTYSVFIPLVSRILLVTKNKDLGMMKSWPSLVVECVGKLPEYRHPHASGKPQSFKIQNREQMNKPWPLNAWETDLFIVVSEFPRIVPSTKLMLNEVSSVMVLAGKIRKASCTR